MKITHWEINDYQLPFKPECASEPLFSQPRRGLIISLQTATEMGCGEIAPWSELHQETMEEASQQCTSVLPSLARKKLPEDLPQLNGAFERLLSEYELYPSVRCGLEVAILNLFAREKNCTLAELLVKNPLPQISINSLLPGHIQDIATQAKRLAAQGYSTVKMKVGQRTIREDLERIRFVSQAIGPTLRLRLDANQAWNLESAIHFGKAIRNYPIDYIEEPLADPTRIPEFFQATGCQVALDESVAGNNVKSNGITAFILKPMALGGFERAVRLARIGHTRQITPIISSTFESPLGLSCLVQLAAAINPIDVPVGLDTIKFFHKDFQEKPLIPKKGKINL